VIGLPVCLSVCVCVCLSVCLFLYVLVALAVTGETSVSRLWTDSRWTVDTGQSLDSAGGIQLCVANNHADFHTDVRELVDIRTQ